MDRDTAIALIASRCGGRTDLSSDGTILAELQYTQDVLEKGETKRDELPWFLLSDIFNSADDLSNDSSQLDTIQFPSGFLREAPEGTLWLYDSTASQVWTKLTKKSSVEDVLESRGDNASSDNTDPLIYAVAKDRLVLGPTYPSSVKTFKWLYYKADTVLSTNIENNWLKYASEMMINHVCVKLARFNLQEETLAATFEAEYEKAAQEVWNETRARLLNNASMEMVYRPRR